MLHLQSISLLQFKNYSSRLFQFDKMIVGIHGQNGVGKTNLLDAIYYLSFTKSYFSRTDSQNVCKGFEGFRIEGHLETQEEMKNVTAILRETGKKEFLVDNQSYDKFSQHIGRFPVVFIAPDDVRLITEASEERRRFLDALLSQLDSSYLQNLINYNRVLQQRNSYLRSVDNRRPDTKLIDAYDRQLITLGQALYNRRKIFLEVFLDRVSSLYQEIAGKNEVVELRYKSQLHETSFENLLFQFRDKDIILQRTHGGIHRDDIDIKLNEEVFKNIASQGQRKSLLFALKLAEFDTLSEAKGFAPILLLDDVFEKLDAGRMHNLLERVCLQKGAQVFITDRHEQRIASHLDQLQVGYQMICL